jgi:hypothetical protein
MPYRRVERKTRTQVMPDGSIVVHNLPNLVAIAKLLAQHIPGIEKEYLASPYSLTRDCPLIAWLADPSGAIPAPAPRPKKPFTREAVA